MAYLDNHHQNPQVFVWSALVERILAKIAKCKEVLDSLHWEAGKDLLNVHGGGHF